MKFSITFKAEISRDFSPEFFLWLELVILELDYTSHTKEFPNICILILDQFFIFFTEMVFLSDCFLILDFFEIIEFNVDGDKFKHFAI